MRFEDAKGPPLHLIKLAAGSEGPESLARWQRACLAREGRLFHRTRQCPRRQSALLSGGSIYWVIRGRILLRQRLLGIEQGKEESGGRRTLLLLDPQLVRTEAKPQRAFQGWRYLRPEDAPPDLAAAAGPQAPGDADPPAAMLAELRSLGLI